MTQPSATPSRKSTAGYQKKVELSARADGTYGALSSDGVTIYTLRQVRGVWACTCKGYAARQTCCHSLAVRRATACACDLYGDDPACLRCHPATGAVR